MTKYRYCLLTETLFFFMLVFPGQSLCFDNWPSTGQNTCYGTPDINAEFESISCPTHDQEDHFGQDSQYSNLQLPRSYTKLDEHGNDLTDNADNWVMVRDNVTGLTWEVKTNDGSIHDRDNTYVWCDPTADISGCPLEQEHDPHTREFIVTLNNNQFGGVDTSNPAQTWRIPTIEELSSLTHAGQPDTQENLGQHPSIDINYFPETKPYENYWSSTPDVEDGNNAWYVSSTLGNTYFNGAKSEQYHVRAVFGKPYTASSAFIDNGNGTITDNTTGLIWQKDTPDADMNGDGNTSWQEALFYCENLELGQYSDWRLPNRKELLSLVDTSRSGPALSFPDNNFPHLFPEYWSSSTNTWHTGRAWYVDFSRGQLLSHSKTLSDYVRAVRGRQVVDLNVIINGPGTGRVYSQATGISCPDDCSEEGVYQAGDLITLTAVADSGFRFTGWSGGNCIGTRACTVVMNRNIVITATFQEFFSWDLFLPAIINQ